jgi:outer membrane protein OmpA-like peptidoglycan-associated protein
MKKIILLALFSLVFLASVHSETFRFKYFEDEKYRTVTTVEEDVYINGRFSHKADILNRISIHVTRVKDGSGLIEAQFQTSERSSGSSGVYEWAQNYKSVFWRDKYGTYDIEPHYFMPVVRNVPTFPERDVEQGETWSAEGREVHDFRTNFDIKEPFAFPMDVSYTYKGKEKIDGRELDVISLRYNVYHRPSTGSGRTGIYPTRISGFSEQRLLWDNKIGRPYSYEEQFEIVIDLSTGTTVVYKGTAEGEVIQSSVMDRDEVAAAIEKQLKEKGVDDAGVKSGEEGVTITLENIQFQPDSAVLLEREKEKLRKIADILSQYPNRDILITGHTALAGTARGRQNLSELRAKTVGNYLLSLGAKEAHQIITRGMGAREPVGDNSTEAGRRKNRRVEITILEN